MNPDGEPVATTLILGGVRSGKSRLAERLAVQSGLPLVYIATATPGDAEMAARIAAHRARRSSNWSVIEEPICLAGVLREQAASDRCLLVECLTLWLSNLLALGDEDQIGIEIEALVAGAKALPGRMIFVGNETNMGIIPMGELSRRYGDLAGSLHQRLASEVDQVILTVAGLPLTLKGPKPEGLDS